MSHLNDNELVLALDGEMEEAELKRAVDHLAECDECRAKWEGLQGVSARVAEYATSLYAHPITQEQKLRRKDEARLLPLKVSSFEFRVPSWGWATVAAVVLVGGSLVFWSTSHLTNARPVAQGPKPGDKDGARVAVNSPSVQSDRGPLANDRPQDDKSNLSSHTRTPNVLHRSRKAAQSGASAQQNSANQFTELPFSDASLPLDQATVVRVTLPAAALRQAGVPVNEDNANAMLQADVVLGMDGLPRGIRLLNSSSGTSN